LTFYPSPSVHGYEINAVPSIMSCLHMPGRNENVIYFFDSLLFVKEINLSLYIPSAFAPQFTSHFWSGIM
jgi:hypothetical protein